MARYGVYFTADVQNLTNLQPAGGVEYHLKLQCSHCGELAQKDLIVCFDQEKTHEKTPRVIKKCHSCERNGSVIVLSGRVPLTEEDRVVKLMELECNGYEPMDFVLGRGWKAENPITGTRFDIDLSSGDYSDYDLKGNCPVAVLDPRVTISLVPVEKPVKAGSKSF